MSTIIFTSKERRMMIVMNKKLSEVDLASKLKVSVTTVRRWLAGTTRPPYSAKVLISLIYQEYKEGK